MHAKVGVVRLVALATLAASPALAVLTGAGPTYDDFMWQGMQQEFVRADGTHCRGRTALAVSQNAVCYVATDDTLHCAGTVYSRKFGPRFTDAGISGVEQILVSPTAKSSILQIFTGIRNGLCVKKTDGTAWCLGSHNGDGQFGNGTTNTSSTFRRWGCSNDLVALGTGNWDQICGLDRAGRVSCAGKSHGAFPAFEPGAHHQRFWVDPTGTVNVDDFTTLRASSGRTDCRIHPRSPGPLFCFHGKDGALHCYHFPGPIDDLACFGGTAWWYQGHDLWGPPSTSPLIVDGGTFAHRYPGDAICGPVSSPFGGDVTIPNACWLTVDGEVMCLCRGLGNTLAGVRELFLRNREDCPTCDWSRIVAMAADPWSGTVCAVPEDGSLWCIGENHSGKLGTGIYDDVAVETQVQPAGSVRVGCEAPSPPPPGTPNPPAPPGTSCPCPGISRLSLTTRDRPGVCGHVTGTKPAWSFDLACNGLYSGAGSNSVPLPIQQPDQTETIFSASACTAAGTLTLGRRTAAEEGPLHCSDAGCLFGAPVPVVNAQSTPTSVCIINRMRAPASGTANCGIGAVNANLSLDTVLYLTGDTATDPMNAIPGIQPCPVCAPSLGSDTCPGDPCTPCCHGGPNNLKPCTPGSGPLGEAYPTSQDCPPDTHFDVGTLPLSFTLTTGTVTWTGTVATNDTGSTASTQNRVFSGYCRDADYSGAFQQPARECWRNGMAVGAKCSGTFESCEQRNNGAFGPGGGASVTIREFGVPAGSLVDGQPHAATLGAIFSIPPEFNASVDAAADIPGPGAESLSVDLRVLP